MVENPWASSYGFSNYIERKGKSFRLKETSSSLPELKKKASRLKHSGRINSYRILDKQQGFNSVYGLYVH